MNRWKEWAPWIESVAQTSARAWTVFPKEAGPMQFQFVGENELGILDHTVTLATGAIVANSMRVTPNGSGSELVMIVLQQPAASAKEFARRRRRARRLRSHQARGRKPFLAEAVGPSEEVRLSPRLRSPFPSLLLAAGIIGGTAISLVWPMAGPIALALIVVGVAAVDRRPLMPAMILGGAVLVAGAMIAVVDATYIPAMMPIFGASAAVSVISNRTPRHCVGVKGA